MSAGYQTSRLRRPFVRGSSRATMRLSAKSASTNI